MSGNNLLDIVNWLKEDIVVCLHDSFRKSKMYCSKNFIKNKIIYVDLKNWPDLIEEDEWPWYIKDAGFVEYDGVLPKEEIYYSLP